MPALELTQIGNSIGVVLPKDIRARPKLHDESRAEHDGAAGLRDEGSPLNAGSTRPLRKELSS